MKKWLMLCFALVLQIQAVEVLVLKNGKMLKVESYQVQGDFVVFQNDLGQTLSLPKGNVDLEKSKEATKAYLEQQTAKEAEYQAKLAEIEKAKQRKQKEMTMGEIAKQVEQGRESATPESVSFDSNSVEKFGEKNPYEAAQRNPNSEYNPDENSIVNQRIAAVNELPAEYQKAKGKLDSLKNKEQSLTLEIEQLEGRMAFDESIGGADYFATTIDKKTAELAKVREDIKEAEQELKQIDKRARSTGINNYKNMKPKEEKSDG